MSLLPDLRADPRVGVARDPQGAFYPPQDAAPYHPDRPYPEYAGPLGRAPNPAYDLVRRALAAAGLDADRFGTADWNPVGALVPPGARIVLKPNWVLHANEGPGGTDCLVTHASVLRALLDYILKARPARVVVGDAPVQVCDFAGVQALGFADVADHFAHAGAPVAVKDFRRTVMRRSAARAEVEEDRRRLDEFVLVNLGANSHLEPIAADAERFRVTMYDPRRMAENHRPGVHRYLVSRDILEADLVLNAPKLKTHKKAGVTLALKNLVGINGNKDYLPHHRRGASERGGDNYERATLPKRLAEVLLDLANRHLDKPRLYAVGTRLIYKLMFLDRIRGLPIDLEGGWYGNDTVWRMCLDLNRVLLYGRAGGDLADRPQRQVLHVTDAIVAGEGEGPLRPDPRPLGAVLAARNAAAHDWAATALMGLDPAAIPIVRHAFEPSAFALASFRPDQVEARLDSTPLDTDALAAQCAPPFRPARGWAGHCERRGGA